MGDRIYKLLGCLLALMVSVALVSITMQQVDIIHIKPPSEKVEYKDILATKITLDHELIKKLSEYNYLFIVGTFILMMKFQSNSNLVKWLFFLFSFMSILLSAKVIMDSMDYTYYISTWLVKYNANPDKMSLTYWNNVVGWFKWSLRVSCLNTIFYFTNTHFLKL